MKHNGVIFYFSLAENLTTSEVFVLINLKYAVCAYVAYRLRKL
jgi:hypothetical protein